MLPDLQETIAALDDWQTIICCRGLVLLMDQKMAQDPRSARPLDLSVTDFNQWIQLGGQRVRPLVVTLCERSLALTSATGRRLMQTCLRWGWDNEIRAACRLTYTPAGHLGTLSPVTVVAALATVMLWHPTQPAMNTLLRTTSGPNTTSISRQERRYPWFQPTTLEPEKDTIE